MNKEKSMSDVTMTIEAYEAMKAQMLKELKNELGVSAKTKQAPAPTLPKTGEMYLDVSKLAAVLRGESGTNVVIGAVKQADGTWHNCWVQTDFNTGEIRYTKSGRLRCTYRPQTPQAQTQPQQAAEAPHPADSDLPY